MPDKAPSPRRKRSPRPGIGGLSPAPLTVVAIGASAGGLEASTRLVQALPDGNGMAFILVQHLDPTHSSMLVDLLAPHTAMPVIEATDGVALESDHLYIIPPGTYLSASGGSLHLSEPGHPRGRRMPFDFLLASIAREYGRRAVCVVLSGTGTDGTSGLVAIKAGGGLVIVQKPDEASYDGMPRSAIATGAVDLVLNVEDIPDALAMHPNPTAKIRPDKDAAETDPDQRAFAQIIDLLRNTTPNDFTLYKPGTLQRRMERRMSMVGADGLAKYLDRLRNDPAETKNLAKDLLINVTSFFRDPKVFERLEKEVIPGLIRGRDVGHPLRIWIAGCSTGEETWSLAILFREQLAASKSQVKLQIFASDVDSDAVARARAGRYPRMQTALREARRGTAMADMRATTRDIARTRFDIEVRPVDGPDEATRLICFVERPRSKRAITPASAGGDLRTAELERDLAAMRIELAEARSSCEASNEEQRALNEEALSVNEEYQSTNEELLTSKEELQSLNEELTALNSQLQETLERQRTASNDMQNVLFSTDVATLFLDRAMKIRFFTPATRSLFNIISSDVGRPLADLVSLAGDTALADDAGDVLRNLIPIEREIEADGAWFVRRVLPYRTDDQGVGGVVITFTDVTERKQAARALEAAKREAENANAAKSRFLAAASHDLRQPLQTLTLLQGLLVRAVEGAAAEKLLARLDDTLGAMSVMLNTVLDINQIDAGVVRTEIVQFPVAAMIAKLRDEFGYQAQAQGLAWRVVQSGLSITSDPRLLEQMVRNLLSNALKYTKRGKVLLGCRRHGGSLRIEVWDTGIGIAEDKLETIFEEYSQLDNAARDRGKGLGLGLSIVERFGVLLGHKIRVRSRRGTGSVFSIEVPLCSPAAEPAGRDAPATEALRSGVVLVVEDEPDVRDLLEIFLRGEGYAVVMAHDGAAALDLVATGEAVPDILLTDYNLPGGLNGLGLAGQLRRDRPFPLPVIVLTGDISAHSLREIARNDCVVLNKPVTLEALTEALQALLAPARAPADEKTGPRAGPDGPVIHIVDDDPGIRASMRKVLEAEGRIVVDHHSSEAFLGAYRMGGAACLFIDATLPGMSGLDLLRLLRKKDDAIPAIMITGCGDVHMAVEAMRAGASDFIEKPISRAGLLTSLERALEQSSDLMKLSSWRASAAEAVQGLSDRQRQIMALVIAGHPSKNIAADLGTSQRTVENHRAAIMHRTSCKSLPALARLALAAAWTGSDKSLVAIGPPPAGINV